MLTEKTTSKNILRLDRINKYKKVTHLSFCSSSQGRTAGTGQCLTQYRERVRIGEYEEDNQDVHLYSTIWNARILGILGISWI